MNKNQSMTLLKLTQQEELLKHNLETRSYWSAKEEDQDVHLTQDIKNIKTPEKWSLTKDIVLYDWQEKCVNKWFEEKRGTIKVATGAGKTILALSIIEKLQALDPKLQVAIIVPTVVLQEQWYDELLQKGNLPAELIGRLGGGYTDDFSKEVRILICVLKSASSRLSAIVAKDSVGNNLLLVADECHKAGAPDMSKVFETTRAYNLGLSATPEREDDDPSLTKGTYDLSLLGKELGPIIFELTVNQALEQGILPEFEIHHYGLPLKEEEKVRYSNLSRRLSNVTSDLRNLGHQFGLHDSNLISRTQVLAKREDQLGMVARQHIALTNERKRLLYNAENRFCAVRQILQQEFVDDKDTRAMLFHETIESVMLLYHQLLELKFPVTVEHSDLSKSLRGTSIELFRQGVAQIIVSARALIEGFNVPETDIGIIVASSTSVRQRIQTIGRLLRKKSKNKLATIYVLYMQDTVDEVIYGKTDWDNLLGAERNRYFKWSETGAVIELEEPPQSPLPQDKDIPLSDLEAGLEYPGAYEGIEFTCDSAGNVFLGEELVLNPQGIPEVIFKVKGSYGRFKVTPNKHYILVLVKDSDDWLVTFVSQLQEPFVLASNAERADEKFDVVNLVIGDVFPAELVGEKPETIYFKQSRGRAVLAKREGRGERYARVGEKATDPKKGAEGQLLLEICSGFKAKHPQMVKLLVTESQYVLFLSEGSYLYLHQLKHGLEFS